MYPPFSKVPQHSPYTCTRHPGRTRVKQLARAKKIYIIMHVAYTCTRHPLYHTRNAKKNIDVDSFVSSSKKKIKNLQKTPFNFLIFTTFLYNKLYLSNIYQIYTKFVNEKNIVTKSSELRTKRAQY